MKGTVKHVISLDLSRAGIQARIPVRQGDALIHNITVILTNGGVSYKPSGAELAQIYALLPDGNTVSCDGNIISDGKISFIPGGGFFVCGGPVICRLSIRGSDGGELYSPAFALDTDPCFAADATAVPAEEYSRMEELLLKVLEAKKSCEDIVCEIRESGHVVSFGTASPLPNGTPSAGTSSFVSRSDHVHPTDDSRMQSIDDMETAADGAVSDFIPYFDVSSANMKKMRIGTLADIVKARISSVPSAETAKAIVSADNATGFKATIPTMPGDSIIALTSDIPKAIEEAKPSIVEDVIAALPLAEEVGF